MFASAAQAYPQGHFACFATVAHTDNQTLSSLFGGDPVIANAQSAPCRADSQSAPASGTNGSGSTIAATSGAASTRNSQNYYPPNNYTPVTGDAGTTQASAQSVVIVSGATVIKADMVNVQASVTCTSTGSTTTNTTGSFALSGSASIGDLSINGTPVTLTGGPQDIPTPAGTLHVDAAYQPVSFALYQRALWLQAPSGDIIAGEAAVAAVNGNPPPDAPGYNSTSGSPCQDGPAPSPLPPVNAFGCWGSALQYTVNHSPRLPFVANGLGGCTDQQASLVNFGFVSDFVTIKAPYADTANTPDPLPSSPPYPNGATSTAEAGAGSVQIGTAITASSLSANATVRCSAHSFVLGGSSAVHGLQVGGVAIGDSTAPINIPILGGTLHVNWTGGAANYVERRALWFESTIGYDVVVGDAIAGVNHDASGNPLNPC